MSTIIPIRGVREAPQDERSKMETVLLTPDVVKQWEVPPFQRPLRINDKVRSIAEELKRNGGIISGLLTLGRLPHDKTNYLIDGQHRREAALISELTEFIADIRIMTFETMADMAEEYVRLNSSIVKMFPDDVLRGLEGSIPPLQHIRKHCPFVGYSYIRLGTSPHNPLLGMSATLRAWRGSGYETPSPSGGKSATEMAKELSMESAEGLVKFLTLVHSAWGRDLDNTRLWQGLNITMCMWLWRVMVVDQDRSGSRRYVSLPADQFKRCMLAISASHDYKDWLVGRILTERDRAPCYRRLRAIFIERLRDERSDNFKMPQPQWARNI